MPYIQITNRCNMHCAHCCYACKEHGVDMTMPIFRMALELVEPYGGSICIGGGEPTLHPSFWEMMGLALGHSEDIPFVATNGSNTQDALKLAKYASLGAMHVALSLDAFHSPIDEIVEKAFDRRKDHPSIPDYNYDCREIRNVTDHVLPGGRASNWWDRTGCVCDDLFIDPFGQIWKCGCRNVSYGTVFNPNIPEDLSASYECKGLVLDDEEDYDEED